MNKKNMYLEDCSVISNSANADGGGIYVSRSGSVCVNGVTAIRNNDGKDTMDNLVLAGNALIYNYGLMPGSEIRLRSTSDGDVKLGGSRMSEYQLNQYFHADHGRLELTDTETVVTELRASVFSEGKNALFIGAAVMIAALAGGVIYSRRRQKGEGQ